MTDNSHTIATRDVSQGFFLAPTIAVESALTIYQAKKDFIDKILRPSVDYGAIPGGNNKPTLLKPGAEKMASFFGLSPTFIDIKTEEDWTGREHAGEPFFYYRVKCQLRRGDMVIGEADGSCNSWEKKYRYRSSGRVCPTCGSPSLLRSKGDKPADLARKRRDSSWEPGWFCWAKKGGCGGQFEFNDTRIPKQDAGNVANPDVAEQVNTILKMAQKRALIAATLIATGVSEYFTQDIEDFTPGEHSYEPPTTIDVAGGEPVTDAPSTRAAASSPPAFDWKGATPEARTKYLLARVPNLTTLEGCAESTKKLKEADVGAEGYRQIMRAITDREKAIQGAQQHVADDAAPALRKLKELFLDVATTAQDLDIAAQTWEETTEAGAIRTRGEELIAARREAIGA